MATKSSNKPRKTTSKQGTPQPKSTVTPIGQSSNGAVTHGRNLMPLDQRIEEEIRIRAYELFEQRGRQEGSHAEDWSRAEAEVLAKYRRDKSA